MSRTTDPLAGFSLRKTPQSRKADERQVLNNASGYTFEVDDEARLRRFLVLGVDGGTYYSSGKELTLDNAAVVVRMAQNQPEVLLSAILDVSLRGAAPRQNATLFALAIACSVGDTESRTKALAALPQVARIGTHLFLFARYVETMRGWGRGLRRAVGDWYLGKDADSVAFQAIKYRQREGWSHRDLLRLSHPHAIDLGLRSTFEWIVREAVDEHTPRLIQGFIKAQAATSPKVVADLVAEYRLTWEMLPDFALKEQVVWDSLLANGLPQTALIRQLPRLTRLGLLTNGGARIKRVAEQLTDTDRLVKARVHPMNVLMAMRTYETGVSDRGSSTWTPVRQVIDALDAAFYNAFGAVEPAGKRTLLALDVSGSMTSPVGGLGKLSCREASAAMALVQISTEPDCDVVGFTGGGWYSTGNRSVDDLTPLKISPRQRLTDAVNEVSNLPFGRTDCALPMLYAAQKGLEYDTFCVYTDNETWAGTMHPHEALQQYRAKSGINAKLVVLGMTATPFTIADPKDPGMLDCAGLDSAVPSLITEFSRGL